MIKLHQIATPTGELNVACGPANGPPLLLLHGVTRRWQDFAGMLSELMTLWQVFALDFRGHGESDRSDDGYLTVDYVRDAVATVESHVSQPVVIYGHSLGAMVALKAASDAPAAVNAIILEDPPFETMGSRLGESPLLSYFRGVQSSLAEHREVSQLAAALADMRFGPPGDEQQLRLGDLRDAASLRFSAACLLKLDPRVLEPITKGDWLQFYDLAEVASRVRCPALILQADTAAGGMLTDQDANLLSTAIAECALVKFPGCGHLLHWTNREQVLSATHAFLESLP